MRSNLVLGFKIVVVLGIVATAGAGLWGVSGNVPNDILATSLKVVGITIFSVAMLQLFVFLCAAALLAP